MEDDNALYDQIGVGYNTTRQADPYIAQKLLELLISKEDKLYLDIGCGTGNYTIAISEKGLSFYGIEPSVEMLDIARKRTERIN